MELMTGQTMMHDQQHHLVGLTTSRTVIISPFNNPTAPTSHHSSSEGSMEYKGIGKFEQLRQQGQAEAAAGSSAGGDSGSHCAQSSALATTKTSELQRTFAGSKDAACVSPAAADSPLAAASRGAALPCSSNTNSAPSSTPATPTRVEGHSLQEAHHMSSPSSVATPRSVGESSITPGSLLCPTKHPTTELVSQLTRVIKEQHERLPDNVCASHAFNLAKLLKETEQLELLIEKEGRLAGDHGFYMNACIEYERAQVQSRLRYVQKLRRTFEESRRQFHKNTHDLAEAITSTRARVFRMAWDDDQKGMALACLQRYTLLLTHDVNALDKTASANEEIRKYIDQVWRTPEQIPPLYKLWKQLRRAIDQLKEVGVSAFTDDQAIEHFHTGMLQNLQMRPIPELMDDYNKTLNEFKNMRTEELRRQKCEQSRLKALVTSPGARSTSPSLSSPSSGDNTERIVLEEVVASMQQWPPTKSAPLHASGGSRHSASSLCRVREDEEDPLVGDFEPCADSNRAIFPENHAPAHVRPQEAVRAAATARTKQASASDRSTVGTCSARSSKPFVSRDALRQVPSLPLNTLSRTPPGPSLRTSSTSSSSANDGSGSARSTASARTAASARGKPTHAHTGGFLKGTLSSTSKENRSTNAAPPTHKAWEPSTPAPKKSAAAAARARGVASAPGAAERPRSLSLYVKRNPPPTTRAPLKH